MTITSADPEWLAMQAAAKLAAAADALEALIVELRRIAAARQEGSPDDAGRID